MRSGVGAWRVFVLGLVMGASCTHAQTTPPTSASTDAELHSMFRLAGVIFAGQVEAVRRHDGINGATGIVEIDFSVEDAIRGVTGSTYTLREWAGLWASGEQPFRVGQRFLMLLHAPGAAGLGSPVGGMDGAIPIRGNGQPALPQTAATRNSVSPADRAVDLRWIATRVARPISYRIVERPTGLPVSARPDVAGGSAPAGESGSGVDSPNTGLVSYSAVLATLRRWQRDDNAAR